MEPFKKLFMIRYPKEGLEFLVSKLAIASGVSAPDARIFADALVNAEMQGTSTHGVSRLSIYLERIQKGLIAPEADLKVERQVESILTLDAGNGLGQVQARKALDLLFPLAEKNGVAAATIRNSQHFGALSYYCNLAADRGYILLAMTNCEPAMSPEGGYQPFFGTNPIAASFPTGKGFNVKIDLSTSTIARGNIIAAQKKKEPIPLGWALDREGQPTTDAEEALLGTVLTMAGHKGYALALMVEIFSSVLSGAAIGPEIGSMYKDLDRKQNAGHFFCLFHISAFIAFQDFTQRMDDTIDKIKASRKRPGVEEILIPGERSARNVQRNSTGGVYLSQDVCGDIQRWCVRLNVPFNLDGMTT